MGRGRKRKVSDEKARNFYLLYLSVKNKIRLEKNSSLYIINILLVTLYHKLEDITSYIVHHIHLDLFFQLQDIYSLHFLNILCLLMVTIFSTFFSSKINNLKAFN